MPALEGGVFSSGNVCEPSCWVEGSCGKRRTGQLKNAGTCYNRDRTVWIPPGQWEDAWNGEVVSGPRLLSVHSPQEQLPLYHRRPGLLLTADGSALNVKSQDRAHLIVEAFPGEPADEPAERLWQLEGLDGPQLRATVGSTPNSVSIRLGCTPRCNVQSWHVRVHLRAHQVVTKASVDGIPLAVGANLVEADVTQPMGSHAARLLPPDTTRKGIAPALQGRHGVAPPALAGAILEVVLVAGQAEQVLVVHTA